MKSLFSVLAFALIVFPVAACKTSEKSIASQIKIDNEGPFPFEEMTTNVIETIEEFRTLAGDSGFYTGYVYDLDSIFPRAGWTGEFFAFRRRNILHADIVWMGKSGSETPPTTSQSYSAMQLFNSGEISGGALYYFPSYSIASSTAPSSEMQLPGTMFIAPAYLRSLTDEVGGGFQKGDEERLHARIATIIERTCAKVRQTIAFTKNVFYVYSLEFVPETYRKHYAGASNCIVAGEVLEKARAEVNQTLVYHEAHSFGYLRKLSSSELTNSDYNAKEIVVIDDVPLDIGPTAGIISLKRQVPDSHIILRAMNLNIINSSLPDEQTQVCDQWIVDGNGDPNCTQDLPQFKSLSTFYNQPVEAITRRGAISNGTGVTRDLVFMRVVSADEVERQLTTRRPNLPDPQFETPTSEFFTEEMSEGSLRASLYGAKGRNFMTLHRSLAKAGYNREKFSGTFLVPFFYYIEHVQQLLSDDLCAKAETKCVEDYLESIALCLPFNPDGTANASYDACLLSKRSQAPFCGTTASNCRANLGKSIQDFIGERVTEQHPKLMSDSRIRRQFFKFAQRLIEEAPLSDALESKISQTILAAHPNSPPRFRFRSSTNAEDIEGLNGAGMYRSAAGCLDLETEGTFSPKKCLTYRERARAERLRAGLQALAEHPNLVFDITDDLQDKRSIPKAVKKVYASLWSEKAYMYRDYFGIDHKKVFMGLLAHSSFMDESANGVAIVRPKANGELEISVTVQLDDISITNPKIPSSYPDQIIVTADRSGSIGNLNYVMSSNLANQDILSGPQLASLIEQIALIYGDWSSKANNPALKLDFEFKRGPNLLPKAPDDHYQIQEQMDIKQVRPL